MKLVGFRSVDDYLVAADEVQAEFAQVHPEWMDVLRECDAIWRTEVFGEDIDLSPTAGSLFVYTYYYWLAALRIALSGHASAVYPVLRTSLESACYGYLIAKQPALADIWLERDRNDDTRKRFRRAFGQGVSEMAKHPDVAPDLSTAISDMYQAAIAFGGHPNPRGILDHLQLRDGGEMHEMSLIALNGARSLNTLRSILAVAEHTYFSAVICANAADGHPRANTLQPRLDALSARFGALVRSDSTDD